jgi:hypothetical protein
MSHSENDVLVCPSSGSEVEFSGFEREDFPDKENESPKVKSVIVKPDRNSKKQGKKLKNITHRNKSTNSKSKDKVTNPGKKSDRFEQIISFLY